ncbi:STM3941 family protein [Parapedobacter tibetensis]|uniref:STM3941 family protein n=1 Tax=Parapedobacter tibetensis TaxID=2972951 RepID=UPI00214D2B1E|nr:STM3941 family protein [Parapedobacter tibetensis]
MSGKIEIPLSKRKVIIALTGSSLFVILGCLATIKPEDFLSILFRNPEVIRIGGIAGVVFFGLCMVFITRKLFDNEPGLTIDEYGITNNTNAISMGLIEWNDITWVEKKQVMSTKLLILHTNNPEKYMQRVKNFISKRAAEMNSKTYGSPISITSNSLNINFEDLEALITREFKRNTRRV